MQRGRIYQKSGKWMLQYRERVLGGDGKPTWQRVACILADVDRDHRTRESVQPLADVKLAPINVQTGHPESVQNVRDFLEYVYLPHMKKNKRPSTHKHALVMFRLVENHLGKATMRDFRTSDVDRLMSAVASEKVRAHTTHRNLKSFLSGAFRFAKRNDLISDNPVRDSVIPRGLSARDNHAYSLEEIQKMLAALPEPARTAVLVISLTGLRVSELKGLRWEDFDGEVLNVRRSVWSGVVNDTKTLSSRAPVPVVAPVREALEAHRKRNPHGNGWIFAGERKGEPLRLENEVRRVIKPALTKAGLSWHGWHGFRRGVGTNLNRLGVDDSVIQSILRHGDISTTQTFYIRPVPVEATKAMKALARAFKSALKK
jgi:integrase